MCIRGCINTHMYLYIYIYICMLVRLYIYIYIESLKIRWCFISIAAAHGSVQIGVYLAIRG